MGYRLWIGLGGLSTAVAVAASAMGVHKFAVQLEPNDMLLFNTAQHWHLVHSIGMILAGMLVWAYRNGRAQRTPWVATLAGIAFLFGILLFSGVIYLQVIFGGGPRFPVVPVGGGLYIAGWVLLALAGFMLPGWQTVKPVMPGTTAAYVGPVVDAHGQVAAGSTTSVEWSKGMQREGQKPSSSQKERQPAAETSRDDDSLASRLGKIEPETK